MEVKNKSTNRAIYIFCAILLAAYFAFVFVPASIPQTQPVMLFFVADGERHEGTIRSVARGFAKKYRMEHQDESTTIGRGNESVRMIFIATANGWLSRWGFYPGGEPEVIISYDRSELLISVIGDADNVQVVRLAYDWESALKSAGIPFRQENVVERNRTSR